MRSNNINDTMVRRIELSPFRIFTTRFVIQDHLFLSSKQQSYHLKIKEQTFALLKTSKMMKYIFVLFIFSLSIILSQSSVISVSNYGAYPDDHLDDTTAIQSAINAGISLGNGTIMVFESGVYNLSASIAIYSAKNLTIIGQGIDQTFLIGNRPTSIFTIQSCHGLTIGFLSIDFDPLPFTAGYVVDVNQTFLDLQVQPPHQTDVNRQVGAILRYDPKEMRPAFGSNTYEIYQSPSANATTSLISPGVLRIPLVYSTQFHIGDAIVARYSGQNHVISGSDAEDLTIDSLNIYTSWCMGFAMTRIRRLNVRNYHVLPRHGRWLSTTADCLNFLDSRESVHISDSTCSSMGDDGLSVHSMYFIVQQVINSTTLIIQTFNWPDTLNFGIGTTLEFSPHDQPFTPYTKGTIASMKDNDSKSRIFIFTQSLTVNANDYVAVSDVPEVFVKNLTVQNNRARGILLQSRNILIKQSTLNRTSGPAILFQPSLYWHEGPGAINVTLTENLFLNNNEGIASEKGMIAILPDPIQHLPVITNIQISSSSFYTGTSSRALVQIFNGNNITFFGNYIATNNSNPLITICNTRNATAENNTLINTQTEIKEFYTLDQMQPCSNNSSTLINIPPSAFNSSFLPPVF